MDRIKNRKTSNRLLLMAIIISIILIAIVLLINGIRTSHAKLLYSQYAGERWGAGDIPYSEISVFYNKDSSITENDIKSVRTKINKKLYEDSFLKDKSDTRVWIDGYSGQTVRNVRKDGTTLEVNVYAVGGDFFLIHPIPLASGSYPDLESPDVNQILLDEYTAWNLFGGNNIAGMKVWIGERIFTVTGVVRVDDAAVSLQAYGNRNSVYVPINALNNNKENEAENVLASCYEAVVPNSIRNYGLNTVAEAVGITFESDEEKDKKRSFLDFGGIEIVENTGRYDVSSLYNRFKNQKYINMKTNDIVYPYWENIARYEEAKGIRTLKVILGLLIIPMITLVCGFIWLFNRRGVAAKPFILLKDKVDTAIEDRKERNYEKLLEAGQEESQPQTGLNESEKEE